LNTAAVAAANSFVRSLTHSIITLWLIKGSKGNMKGMVSLSRLSLGRILVLVVLVLGVMVVPMLRVQGMVPGMEGETTVAVEDDRSLDESTLVHDMKREEEEEEEVSRDTPLLSRRQVVVRSGGDELYQRAMALR